MRIKSQNHNKKDTSTYKTRCFQFDLFEEIQGNERNPQTNKRKRGSVCNSHQKEMDMEDVNLWNTGTGCAELDPLVETLHKAFMTGMTAYELTVGKAIEQLATNMKTLKATVPSRDFTEGYRALQMKVAELTDKVDALEGTIATKTTELTEAKRLQALADKRCAAFVESNAKLLAQNRALESDNLSLREEVRNASSAAVTDGTEDPAAEFRDVHGFEVHSQLQDQGQDRAAEILATLGVPLRAPQAPAPAPASASPPAPASAKKQEKEAAKKQKQEQEEVEVEEIIAGVPDKLIKKDSKRVVHERLSSKAPMDSIFEKARACFCMATEEFGRDKMAWTNTRSNTVDDVLEASRDISFAKVFRCNTLTVLRECSSTFAVHPRKGSAKPAMTFALRGPDADSFICVYFAESGMSFVPRLTSHKNEDKKWKGPAKGAAFEYAQDDIPTGAELVEISPRDTNTHYIAVRGPKPITFVNPTDKVLFVTPCILYQLSSDNAKDTLLFFEGMCRKVDPLTPGPAVHKHQLCNLADKLGKPKLANGLHRRCSPSIRNQCIDELIDTIKQKFGSKVNGVTPQTIAELCPAAPAKAEAPVAVAAAAASSSSASSKAKTDKVAAEPAVPKSDKRKREKEEDSDDESEDEKPAKKSKKDKAAKKAEKKQKKKAEKKQKKKRVVEDSDTDIESEDEDDEEEDESESDTDDDPSPIEVFAQLQQKEFKEWKEANPTATKQELCNFMVKQGEEMKAFRRSYADMLNPMEALAGPAPKIPAAAFEAARKKVASSADVDAPAAALAPTSTTVPVRKSAKTAVAAPPPSPDRKRKEPSAEPAIAKKSRKAKKSSDDSEEEGAP